ncbi:MAG: hypothetical protein HC851_03895 [Acaryochloris sp. RU_4_1]|nr:hypothetical protein [Acaryochloris sp. SU_5_25]NJM64855.1 hypothetical protein [Acaryochloris sp. RU_4_1]NJR54487.1 hypothetical protein [Acaryochloris sp. CRU_2_0]
MTKGLTSTLFIAFALATVGAAWTLPAKAQQNSQITSRINPNDVHCDFYDDGSWECYE